MERIRRILVPTDFSQSAHRALECAADIAMRYNAGVDVLHALPQGSPLNFSPQRIDTESTGGAAAQNLEKCLAILRRMGVSNCRGRLMQGAAARTIVAVAQDGVHQLIVMATHGGTGLADTLIGSCTERVVRRSSTPVLVLPSPRELLEEAPGKDQTLDGLVGWVTGFDSVPGALARSCSVSTTKE